MTVAQAITKCKVLIDKYGSPTILDPEWIGHLNTSQWEVLNRVVPDEVGGKINLENDENVLENFKQLIFPLTLTPSSGLLSSVALRTAIRTASGDTTCDLFRVLNMAKSDNTMIKFVRHNNIYSSIANVFKAPSATKPIYTVLSTGYQIYPGLGTSVLLTVMKTPLILTNTGESFEVSDYIVEQIILQAVKLAAVGVRDQEAIMDVRATGFQNAQ
jgi:hypothetical protein